MEVIATADYPVLPSNKPASTDRDIGELEGFDDGLRLVRPDVHMAAVEGCEDLFISVSVVSLFRSFTEEDGSAYPWLGRVEVDALDSFATGQKVAAAHLQSAQLAVSAHISRANQAHLDVQPHLG